MTGTIENEFTVTLTALPNTSQVAAACMTDVKIHHIPDTSD